MRCTLFILALVFFASCGKSDDDYTATPDDLTGNQVVYNLYSASDFDISGFVTFKEKLDGSMAVEVRLSNTNGEIFHPVHLHAGGVDEDGPLISVLNPVLGKTGESNSELAYLMINESQPFTYEDLLKLDGSLRIHLDGGPGQDIVIAAANLGTNNNLAGTGIKLCTEW